MDTDKIQITPLISISDSNGIMIIHYHGKHQTFERAASNIEQHLINEILRDKNATK